MTTICEFSTLEEAQNIINALRLKYPFYEVELLSYTYDSGRTVYGVKLTGDKICGLSDFLQI
jgi:hypothetical protein